MTDSNELTARAVAPMVVKALGKEWTIKPTDNPHDDNVTLAHVSGASIGLRTSQYGDKGKIVCGGYGTHSAHQVRIEGTHEIRVSVSRGASVIAAELTRRLLPDYLAAFAKQTAAIAEYDAGDRAIERTTMELWEHAGKPSHKPWRRSNGKTGPMQFYAPGASGAVIVHSATSIEIEVRGVHPEAARAILDVLRHHAAESPDDG